VKVVPITISAARVYVEVNHSHLHAPVGGLFALSIVEGEAIVCVAVVGRPVARMLQNGTTCEVTRLCSSGTPHAASMALAACARAAVALGYTRIVSSTILGESGTCYRAAGWRPVAIGSGGEWFRESHPGHSTREVVQPGRKVRWETGPEGLPADPAVDAAVRAAAGTIAIPARRETLPLFRTGA
jgi:hypothetical protein